MGTDESTDQLTDEMEAMTLWERHMKQATERWHEGVEHSGEEYRQGLAEGLGVDPEDVPDEAVEHWKESVMNTSAEEFAGSIDEEGPDWLVGMYEGVTGKEPSPEVKQAARDVVETVLEEADQDTSDEELTAAVHEEIRRRAQGSSGTDA